ncbi:MAG: glycine--tRNA ligase, partial [Fibrobacter sp.]|nr:glycine--tRNA ligase [Fibrobacter sp.]
LGVERLLLVLLCDAYEVEKLENDERTVLHFDPKIAPVKVAVLPLVKKGQVKAKAEELYQKLLNRWNVEYDETQSIGKRYRRQDELGTPFCVTVDFDTVGEGESDPAKLGFVTVRERDSMKQELVKIDELEAYLSAKLGC